MENFKSDDINAKEWDAFPKENVPNSTKEKKEWILSYIKAMYYRQFKNAVYRGYYDGETARIINNRKWAEGLNSVDEFKPMLGVNPGSTSYLNLDYSIIPIIKKYVNIRVGEMTNMEYAMIARAIDTFSLTQQDKERKKRENLMKIKPISDEIKEESGIPLIPSNEYIPESQEELELHFMMNFKLDTEVAMEKGIDYHLLLSDWKDKIFEKICTDLVTIKKAAVKTYFDENESIRLKYVDWGNCVYPYSLKDDFSDAKYFGEIEKFTIADIKRMDKKNQLTDEDLFKIAYKYQGKEYGNKVFERDITTFHQYFERNGSTGEWYDDFLIPVLDAEIISVSVDKWEEKPNNKGGYFFNKKSSEYKLDDEKKSKGRKLVAKEIEYKYVGKWIVDTDFIIDYGMANDMQRERRSGKISPKCKSSYVLLSPDMLDMQNRSMVEDIIPSAKQIQLASLKIQQLMAKMSPPGKAVDVAALKNVILGKGKEAATPLELMDLAEATGYNLYMGTDDNGVPMNRKPIEGIKDYMGGALAELTNVINFYMLQIERITGINESRDASTPDNDRLVGLQKMALQASRNATRKIDRAAIKMLKMSSERICSMFQYNIKHGRNVEQYKQILGSASVDVVKAMQDLPLAEFGIFIEAKMDEEERAVFEQNLAMAVSTKELRPEDADMARQIINTKTANKFLNYRRRKYQEEQMAIAQKNAQDNAMIQQQSAQAKMEADAQLLQMKIAGDIEKMKAEYTLKDDFEQKQFERNKELEMLKIHNKADRDFDVAAMKSAVRKPAQAAA